MDYFPAITHSHPYEPRRTYARIDNTRILVWQPMANGNESMTLFIVNAEQLLIEQEDMQQDTQANQQDSSSGGNNKSKKKDEKKDKKKKVNKIIVAKQKPSNSKQSASSSSSSSSASSGSSSSVSVASSPIQQVTIPISSKAKLTYNYPVMKFHPVSSGAEATNAVFITSEGIVVNLESRTAVKVLKSDKEGSDDDDYNLSQLNDSENDGSNKYNGPIIDGSIVFATIGTSSAIQVFATSQFFSGNCTSYKYTIPVKLVYGSAVSYGTMLLEHRYKFPSDCYVRAIRRRNSGNNTKTSDGNEIVEVVKIPAHKVILNARLPQLLKLFGSSEADQQDHEVHHQLFSESIVTSVIDYCYSNLLFVAGDDNLQEYRALAELLNSTDLMRIITSKSTATTIGSVLNSNAPSEAIEWYLKALEASDTTNLSYMNSMSHLLLINKYSASKKNEAKKSGKISNELVRKCATDIGVAKSFIGPLLKQGIDSDFTLLLRDKQYKVHKFFLTCNSAFFSDTLLNANNSKVQGNDEDESFSNSTSLDLSKLLIANNGTEPISPKTLELVLQFVYCGTLIGCIVEQQSQPQQLLGEIHDILQAASFFGYEALVNECEDLLVDVLDQVKNGNSETKKPKKSNKKSVSSTNDSDKTSIMKQLQELAHRYDFEQLKRKLQFMMIQEVLVLEKKHSNDNYYEDGSSDDTQPMLLQEFEFTPAVSSTTSAADSSKSVVKPGFVNQLIPTSQQEQPPVDYYNQFILFDNARLVHKAFAFHSTGIEFTPPTKHKQGALYLRNKIDFNKCNGFFVALTFTVSAPKFAHKSQSDSASVAVPSFSPLVLKYQENFKYCESHAFWENQTGEIFYGGGITDEDSKKNEQLMREGGMFVCTFEVLKANSSQVMQALKGESKAMWFKNVTYRKLFTLKELQVIANQSSSQQEQASSALPEPFFSEVVQYETIPLKPVFLGIELKQASHDDSYTYHVLNELKVHVYQQAEQDSMYKHRMNEFINSEKHQCGNVKCTSGSFIMAQNTATSCNCHGGRFYASYNMYMEEMDDPLYECCKSKDKNAPPCTVTYHKVRQVSGYRPTGK